MNWPMNRRTRGALTIALLALLGFVSIVPAFARRNEGMMLSLLLKAPIQGQKGQPIIGDPEPAVASVNDLLVARDGHVDVIAQTSGKKGAGSQREIPWSALTYDPIRNVFHFRSSAQSTEDYEPFYGAVASTEGTVNGFLASKLLRGAVETANGENIGTVKDARLRSDGTVKRLFFEKNHKTESAPWSSVVDVTAQKPAIAAKPKTQAVVVVRRDEASEK